MGKIDMTEAVEVCPYCEEENIYPNHKPEDGYIVTCKHCGKKIFLCDECMHADDNPNGKCDWHKENRCGCCFRGVISPNRRKKKGA